MDPTTWKSCLGDPFRAPASNPNNQTNSVNPGENEGAPQASSSSTNNESYPKPDIDNIPHCLSVLTEANYYRLNPFRGWSIPRLHEEVLRETIHLNDVLRARHFQHYIHELSVHEDPEVGHFAHGLLCEHIDSTIDRCVEVEAQMVRPARLEQLVHLVGFLRKVVRAKYADTDSDSSSEYEFVRERFRPAICPECGYTHRARRIRRTRDRGARGRGTRGRGTRGRGTRGRGSRGRGSRGRGGQGSRAVDLRNPYYHRRFIEDLAEQGRYWDWPWIFHISRRRRYPLWRLV